MAKRKQFTQDEVEEIKKRYADNVGLLTIAKALGTSQGPITRVLKENDVEIKKIGVTRKAIKDEQEIAIIEKYKDGMTAKEIAAEYRLSDTTVLKVLKRAGYDPYQDNQERKKKLSLEQKKEIVQEYNDGKTAQQLGKKYGVSSPTIKKALLELNVKVRGISEANGTLSAEEKQGMVDLYKQGWNTVQLAEKYGMGDGTIGRYLEEAGVQKRTWSEARGGLSNKQKEEVVSRYLDGETSVDIAKDYEVFYSTILRAVKESGNEIRSLSESKIMKTERDLDIDDIVNRYEKGESAISIAEDYPVTDAGIRSLLRRQGVEIRDKGTWGDSVRNIIDGTGNFINDRDTEYYIVTIHGYPGILKPGIAHDADKRKEVSSGYYDQAILVQTYGTRAEAYLLEQAILDQTSAYSVRPKELEEKGWEGIGELRQIEEKELVSIFEFFHNELLEMGIWSFASAYVPMTNKEKEDCENKM